MTAEATTKTAAAERQRARAIARRRLREWGETLRCVFATDWAGPRDARRLEQVRRGLEELQRFGAAAPSPENGAASAEPSEAPVFLCAVGWRTGSTLLQRILATDRRLMMWGEPMARFGMISRLAEMFRFARPAWPLAFFTDRHPPVDDPAAQWLANHYPPAADFAESLRDQFRRWLAVPAARKGYTSWGLKETRLDAADALFLRWLFPRSRFIVLLRDPRDALRSSKSFAQPLLLHRSWPGDHVRTSAQFAGHWNRLALSWRDMPASFGHVVVKYEELVSGAFDFRAFEAALGLKLDEQAALALRIRGTQRPLREPLSARERWVVKRVAAEGLSAYGYR